MEHGVHNIAPMVCRGLLLDVPRALGLTECPPAYEITPGDLAAAKHQQQVQLRDGDVVLVRSGWGRRFDEGADSFVGAARGVPGVGAAGAGWLADHGARAVGADTIAFERLAPGEGHSVLPAHRVLLVERGVYIIEALALDELAAADAHEFTFVLIPLYLVGATGSPVRPLAVMAGA
jgi:kynurenine formamidase